MFSTTIKRSVGALAVTAGLLAAAAPASHGATQPPSSAPVTMTDYIVSSLSWGMSTPTSAKAKAAKGKHANGHAKARYAFYDLLISS